MNKKIVVGLIILIFIIAALTGCVEDKKKKSSGPSFTESDGELNSTSDWLDSDMGDSQQKVSATLPLKINASTKLTEIIIKMKFDDHDSDHAESDDGSDPDDVTITLTNGNMESAPVKGTTPCNLEITMAPNETAEEESMYGTWEISVNADCGAGKPYTIIPRPGMFSFLQYKDQGIAYKLEGVYTYLE